MESPRSGIFGRVGEKVLTFAAIGLLILIVVFVIMMDPVTRTSIWQGLWRSIFWVGGVAALPWVSRFFMRRILEMGSNWAGVGLIAAFVLVDLVFGLVMLSGCDTSVELKRQEVVAEQQQDSESSGGALDTLANPVETVRREAADVLSGLAETVRPDPVEAAAPAQTPDEAAGGEGYSGWAWLAGLAALAVAGTYNYLVTEYVAEQAGG